MKRIASFVAPLVALALALTYAKALRAADAPAADATTGKVAVTVTDKDGKPVEGATVRVTAPKAAAGKTSDKSAPQAAGDKAAGGKNAAPAVAEGKTDKDGKATLENIPAGDYNLSANLKGQGNARQKITVKAGDTLTVSLQLAAKAGKNG
jgi:hypothetical protein